MNKRKIQKSDVDQSQLSKQAKILYDEPTPEKTAIKFDIMLSLQNIVLVKIVKHLWMNQNTPEEIVKLFGSHISDHGMWREEWNKIENNIVAKISQFSLPVLISSKLTYIVPALGKSIRQWITHFDEVLVQASHCYEYDSKYRSVYFFNNITWSARGKIDYAQTARNILSNPNVCLSDDAKFNIACIYCLEDEITLLAPNVNKYCLFNISRFMHPMIYFWSTHITGNNSKLYRPLHFHYTSQNRNMSISEHILCMLIEKGDKADVNETITYVWNKLSAEEKDKYITLLIKQLDNQDLKYTLLSSINYEQQQGIFKEYSNPILVGILKDWLWEEYFLPTTLHFLDVMKPSDFLYILKKVTKRIIKNSQKENKFMYNQYKSIFKELWNKSSRNLKDFVIEHENGLSLRDFLISLSCKQNMDIINLILKDLNTQQRKNMMSDFYGIGYYCSFLIKSDLWDFLKLFLTPSFFSVDDLIQFKKIFVKHEGLSITVHFLKQNALDKIEHFMRWVFTLQEEIDQFRKSLSHDVICKATLESIITHNKADFMEVEKNFNWCANGDLKVINEFKAEIPKSFHFQVLIEHLIENDHYDLLDKVLNWCFLDDQQKIVQFKSNMYKNYDLDCCIKTITVNLIEVDNSFTMLEKFVGWCFVNEQEINQFKTWLLYPVGGCYSICAELIFRHGLELADKFLNWCIISSEVVSIYKNTLMLSEHDMGHILNSVDNESQTDMQLLIKWFNPSKVTLEKFRTALLEGNVPNYHLKLHENCMKLLFEIENFIVLKDNEEITL